MTELQQKLIEFFAKDDPLLTVDALAPSFPSYTKAQLTEALEGLCDTGGFYKADTFCGAMYAMDTTVTCTRKITLDPDDPDSIVAVFAEL